jgi:hypothetical protein
MKAKASPKRIYRGVYLPACIDKKIREIATQERRSFTKTTEILLEAALNRNQPAGTEAQG